MKEAMKQALDALENHAGNYKLDDAGCDRHEKAIKALEEALAKQEQDCGHESCDCRSYCKNKKQEQGEPVAFKIYKPTPPRGAIPNVRDAELPWVYDQDPSSGNVASMWVTPVQTLRNKT